MNGADIVNALFPATPGPAPAEGQAIEQVEVLQAVAEEQYGCAVLPRRFEAARPVALRDWFARNPPPTVTVRPTGGEPREVPAVEVPNLDLWGVELDHGDGTSTLAAYYWGNVAGYRWFAYADRATAEELGRQLLELQEGRA